MKTIGILGGLGPGAGAQLYQNIIAEAQHSYGAAQDGEHPRVVLHTVALTGFDEAGSLDNPVATQELITALMGIEQAGADFIVIACNTVHLLYDELESAINIPIIHLVEEVVAAAAIDHDKIGVLSSAESLSNDLYFRLLNEAGCTTIAPSADGQKQITEVIKSVMEGNVSDEQTAAIKLIANSLINQGATAIVLGCTELPLALSQEDMPNVKIFDSLKIAAKAATQKAFAT